MIFVDSKLYGESIVANPSLENNTWKTISKISEKGEGANYWSIGDMKNVFVSGQVGTLSLNYTFQVFIIGFDHNKDLEGAGITFQCFKDHDNISDSVPPVDTICLCDENYGEYDPYPLTEKYFSMSHGNEENSVGWKGCDMRYDILGSTDTFNGDASPLTTTSPVPNTLMAALPEELRLVMKPMTVYTDGIGFDSSKTEADVIPTVDYLPLLGAYEFFPAEMVSSAVNTYEENYQEQYEYYKNGGSPVKCKQFDLPYSAVGGRSWALRTPIAQFSWPMFVIQPITAPEFSPATEDADKSIGIAPIFRV